MKKFREPSLRELFADPIVDLLMARDGVRRETVLNLLVTVAQKRLAQELEAQRAPESERYWIEQEREAVRRALSPC